MGSSSRWGHVVWLACISLAVACGGETQNGGPTPTSSTGGATSSGGAGGTGGGSNSGGEAGSGGSVCVPQAEELCDGIDNTCEGEIDEGCACIEGDTEPCFTGDPSVVGVGLCVEGVHLCDIYGVMGTECLDEVVPSGEVCNGEDDDCNGTADEGLGTVTCGLGNCQTTVDACVAGQPTPCIPGAPQPESCDGDDDDCDGTPDNGCVCTDGEVQSCYGGNPTTLNVGECKSGLQTCDLNGVWGDCFGDVMPTTEVCNGKDDDCDGTADDGDPGGGSGCSTGLLGVCAAGTRHCIAGSLVCQQNVQSSAETCDGKDDDCDGIVDDGNPGGGQACNTGQLGICGIGTTACQAGAVVCVQNQPAAPEVCDGFDNDCDGFADENNPQGGSACATGSPGICATGTTKCLNGSVICEQTTLPGAESCDGLDNDCDAAVDEGNPGGGAVCNTGLAGVCGPGTTQCQAGALSCVQNVASSTEVCDALDNNCNGTADEGNPGGGVTCNTGLVGVCATGTRNCVAGALACEQNVASSSEICDNLDNNCNGTADEGNPGGGIACSTGLQGVCAAGTRNCVGGSLQCQQNTASSSEVCDGADNDCDGSTDEGNPGGGAPCTTGLSGVCGAGTVTCQAGALACVQNQSAGAELCDNLDNDCNGQTDEGDPGGGASCSTGVPGACSVGVRHCQSGALACTQTVFPGTEVCDGSDNDCDGSVDENDPGGGAACGTGLPGVCAAGVVHCQSGSLNCSQTTASSNEVCDNLDNDCDGSVDENNPGGGAACGTGLLGVCNAGTMTCTSGSVQCVQNQSASTETCNGVDDDCDGQTDEGDPGGGAACNTGLSGLCAAGHMHCQSGSLSCTPDLPPSPEVCDGIDNNCNGGIDEGNPGGGASCNTGVPGACATGQTACVAGAVSCQQTVLPGTESCGNAVDEDCDGLVDEACTCQAGTKANCDGNVNTGTQGCECNTGTCCGTGCQVTHDNGFGQAWTDCAPLDTYDVTEAMKACEAYSPGQCAASSCGGGGVVCSSGAGAPDCICWSYGGSYAGFGYNNPPNKQCYCGAGSAWH